MLLDIPAFQGGEFLFVIVALAVGIMLPGERLGPGLLGLLAKLLQPVEFAGLALAPADILPGAFQQVLRELQPAGDHQGVAHPELADVQAVGRPERFDVELHRPVLGPLVGERIGLQVAQMRGDNRPATDDVELVQDRPAQGRPLGRVGAGAEFVEQHQALFVGLIEDGGDAGDVGTEGGERLLDALFVADVGQNIGADRHDAPRVGRDVHAALGHQAQQTGRLEGDGLPPGVRPGDHQHVEAETQSDVDRHHLLADRFLAGLTLGRQGLVAKEMFQEQVAGVPQPQPALVVHFRATHAVFAGQPRLRTDKIAAGHHTHGGIDVAGIPPDLSAEFAQNPPNLAVLLALEDHALGGEPGNGGRFDEDRLAGGAGAMDHALDLCPVIGGHGQHVMVAVDRGVRVTQDRPQLRIAQQAFDLVLNPLLQGVELAAHLGQVGAGGAEDMPPPVDARGDGFRHRPHVLDRRQHLDQANQRAVEAHPVAVKRPGGRQRVGDLQQLIGGEHRADGGPANDQPDIINPAERRRLARFEGGHHFRDQRQFLADLRKIPRRFDLPGQFRPQRRGRALGEQRPHLVEFQQFQRVSVHVPGVRCLDGQRFSLRSGATRAWFGSPGGKPLPGRGG